jgi:restriction system protein
MTSAWVVRGGNHGQSEEFNLERGRATIGWPEIGDLTSYSSREAVRHLVDDAYPGDHPGRLAVSAGQLWAFRQAVQQGDLVLMPLKTKPGYLAFGRCVGEYSFDSTAPGDRRHFLPVDWQPEHVSRAVLKDDLLAMVNGAMTVFSPSRNNAAVRLEAVAAGGIDPGSGVPMPSNNPAPAPAPSFGLLDPPQLPTLDAIRDRVRTRIVENFGQHKLTHLVADILTALGFVCEVSPAGPDQGIDIRAGRGPLGLDAPIIVEVKSEPTSVSAQVMRGLHSAMIKNSAPQGLLVAMGGITGPAKKEFESLRSVIQVWDAETLLDQLFATYHLLPESTKAGLPLRQVWVLDDDSEA